MSWDSHEHEHRADIPRRRGPDVGLVGTTMISMIRRKLKPDEIGLPSFLGRTGCVMKWCPGCSASTRMSFVTAVRRPGTWRGASLIGWRSSRSRFSSTSRHHRAWIVRSRSDKRLPCPACSSR